MKTYGVGIIGAGFMGRTHTYNYINIPLFYDSLPFRIKLLGICNRTLNKAELLRDEFGYEFATDNYQDLLGRKDIDIIDICTPNNVHYQQIMDALKAGKNVYAEKPLCITDQESEDIVEQANKAGITNQVVFHNRFYPAVKKMKILVNDGFLGKPLFFRAVYYHSSNLDPKRSRGWRQVLSVAGGGVLYDMGSHVLDLIYHLFGEYERVSMYSTVLYPRRADESGSLQEVKTEDHVLINAKMKNGTSGTMEISKIIVGSNDDLNIELYGTEGAIRFSLMDPSFLYIYDARDQGKPIGGMRGYKAIETLNKDPDSRSNFPGPRFGIGWLRGHIASQYNFLKCVHEKKQASPSFEEGAYIQKVMNCLYEVKNKEKWITV